MGKTNTRFLTLLAVRKGKLRTAWVCGLLACAIGPAIAEGATKTKGPAPAQGAPAQDATLCSSLEQTFMKRISSMKALEVAIAKEREKPAATLSGLFTQLSGGEYEGVVIKRQIRRLERERAGAGEVNRLLASSNCAQFDIDAELAKASAGEPAVDTGPTLSNDPMAHDPLRGRFGQ